jgi:hypothetical protein
MLLEVLLRRRTELRTAFIPKQEEPVQRNGVTGGVYGMAFLGAAVYYIQHANTLWAGVLGIFKAIFWPGVLMYKVLELLRM